MKRWVIVTALVFAAVLASVMTALEMGLRTAIVGGWNMRLLLEVWLTFFLRPGLGVFVAVALFLSTPAAVVRGVTPRRWRVVATLVVASCAMGMLTMCAVHCVLSSILGGKHVRSECLLWWRWGTLDRTALELVFLAGTFVAWGAWYFALRRLTKTRQPRQWVRSLSLCLLGSAFGTMLLSLFCRWGSGTAIALPCGVLVILISLAPAVFYRLGARRERLLKEGRSHAVADCRSNAAEIHEEADWPGDSG